MTDRQEAAYQLVIADWVSKKLRKNPYYSEMKKALDACWDWLLSGGPRADDLYYLLDDGTGFGGLFILMQMDDQASEDAWDIIFNACARVTLLAYETEDEIAPALIENGGEEEVTRFFEKTSDTFLEKAEQVKTAFKLQLSKQNQLDRKALLAYFEDLVNKENKG